MKSLIIITAALLGSQAFAAKLVCINSSRHVSPEPENVSQIDQRPEVLDYLEVVGLLDSEGLLEVREDQPTMATFVSKLNHVDLCRGVNINPDQAPQAPKAGWKSAKLDSGPFRIRLNRNQQTGEVTALAAVPDQNVVFRNCQFIKEADDDEIVRKKMEELETPMEDLNKEQNSEVQSGATQADAAEGTK